VDDLDQFLGRRAPWVILSSRRIDHVLADMILDDFGDESVHGAAAGGRLLQHRGALFFLGHGALDGFDLPSTPLESIEQFRLPARETVAASRLSRRLAGSPPGDCFVDQGTLAFASPYRGPNSLDPGARGRETADVTLYLGFQPWTGAEAWAGPDRRSIRVSA
jgi:hypothetical protein